MKKTVSLLMGLLFAFGSGAALAGCGGGDGGGDNGGSSGGGSSSATECLTIRYFKGGYGDEWLKSSVKNFFVQEKGVANPKEGTHYKLIEDASITSNQETYLKNNVPDILITQGGYESRIVDGLIENLTDVFDTKVYAPHASGADAEGMIKIKDYMMPEAYHSVTRQMKYGKGSVHSWVMPWSTECFSLAYNETLLLDTEHVASSYVVGEDIQVGEKWTRTPETIDELLAYFADVEAGTSGKVPFGWSYPSTHADLQFIVNVWWAQIQGTTESKIEGESSFYDFFNFNDLNLLDQTGIQMAFDTLRSLIMENYGTDAAKYVYSDNENNIKNLDLQAYKRNAANGRYAVWATGDYFENEYIKTLEWEPDFTTKYMFVPNAKGVDGKYTTEKFLYARTDEAFYVPMKAENKALAKEFLVFMCNESELLNYSKICGGLRPFDYNPLQLEPDYEWTAFQKSFYEMYNTADEILLEYPKNIMDSTKISPVYLYNKDAVHFYMAAGFKSMFIDGTKDMTAKAIVETVKKGTETLFSNWEDSYDVYFDTIR